MIRKLASVQKVENIEHIKILAWHLVAQKDQFKIGESVIFTEIDSVLPENPEFEFLRKCCYIDKNGFKGFRVKSTRRLDIISQGIAFSMSILPEGEYKIGDDVTAVLGIKKYDPPLPASLNGLAVGKFPIEIPQTDEIRIHSAPDILKRHAGKRVYATLKCDGSSATYIIQNNLFRVCSKNIELQDTPSNTFWQVAHKYYLEQKMREYSKQFGDFAIQGELVGPGIRKNRHGLDNHDVYVFSVYSLKENKYLDYKDAMKVVSDLGLKFVPFMGEFDLDQSVEELEKMLKRTLICKSEGYHLRYCLQKVWCDYE
jgi:RNA ligase (TIGR02306 family)